MVSSIDDPLPVAIYAHGKALTTVLRKGSKDYDDFIRVPPIKLGFWLIDNWWRIRWECRPLSVLTAEWQMVHDISSIGGGYPWPELTLWGEDDQIGINVVGDSADEIGAVRFITSGTFHIQAADFQESVTQFIGKLTSDRSKDSNDHDILKDQFAAWQSEMNDPEVSAWRRMEARLGYNPDTAPDDLMVQMSMLESTYGSRSIEEAAMAAPGAESSKILNDTIELVKQKGLTCQIEHLPTTIDQAKANPYEPAWKAATNAAADVRELLGLRNRPLLNQKLFEILQMPNISLGSTMSAQSRSYGLRLSGQNGRQDRIALHSKTSEGQRFELVRALGDKLFADTDQLGPISSAKSARQQFQRAFAQALLCPIDDLIEYMDSDKPTEEDIWEASKKFHVSTHVVENALLNNGYRVPGKSDGMYLQ